MTSQLFVAPAPRGLGNGRTADDAADYRDFSSPDGFWRRAVPQALEGSGVDSVHVEFLAGDYVRGPLALANLGHETRPLILQGAAGEATVLRIPPGADSPKTTLGVTSCRNLILRNLTFTGDGEVGYVSHIGDGSRAILLEDCVWRDLPNFIYGATGAAGPGTQSITYKRCRFRRIGTRGGAHMMYHANDCRHINVINCTFEDCSGDYVRFRNNVDHCVVSGCSFRSTGTYPPGAPASMPFIAMPLFNDCEPGSERCPDPDHHVQYEYFATNYVIANNVFTYEFHPGRGSRNSIGFYHRGYDPPRRKHLMTAEEGRVLQSGTASQRRSLLLSHCGIDMGKISVYGNRYTGVELRFAFSSTAQYGAKSRGWDDTVEINDLAFSDPPPRRPSWLEAFQVMFGG